ncbi:MAG TPA: zf-HC2 domain-containing protein [Gemmatimonadales bacterium]|nr:zf-HC2 domain-containing protein [Gemmatimonadales bacterium]
MNEHPDTEEIAAYLSHGLPSAGRAKLEAHLASCRDCRREVTSARRLLYTGALRSRWPMVLPAAIAAILALTLLGRWALAPPVERQMVRGPVETDRAQTIPAFSPLDDAIMARASVRFAWAGQSGRPLYRLTLTDGSGKALWIQNTADTMLSLPADLVLDFGRTYFWYVDALDSTGTSLTTGTRRFSVAP